MFGMKKSPQIKNQRLRHDTKRFDEIFNVFMQTVQEAQRHRGVSLVKKTDIVHQ